MTLTFYKYQGTGNDFVIIDNRDEILTKNDTKLFARLCDRKFGVGADGLILLEHSKIPGNDFSMVYFNADGNESTMCGNGGRCLVAFASYLGVIKEETVFDAVDGLHAAKINNGIVSLQMQNVSKIENHESHYFLNTGSPHHVSEVNDLDAYDVYTNGKKIRNGAPYYEEGTNVNFVEKKNETLFAVRTYERGVENETLSCGTGVTAVALAMHNSNSTKSEQIDIQTPGGILNISFKKSTSGYDNIFLTGPAMQVFKGEFIC